MVLELNSTPKNIQKSALKSQKVQCGAMQEKKAIYELIKCSYFKQERLFIILLNSTAMESFRIEHIVAAAAASGTDLRKQRSQQLLLCLQLARNRETVAHFLFFFKRRFLKKKKKKIFSASS